MAVVDIYSKRVARLRGVVTDVLTYDALPQPLRVQIWQITNRVFGDWFNDRGNSNLAGQRAYKAVTHLLREEYGVFRLSNALLSRHSDEREELMAHILNAPTDQVLDAVELICRIMAGKGENKTTGPGSAYQDAITDMNKRFRERGVGYEFTNGDIIRVDSQLLHAEVVKPALALLSDKAFTGAQDEFLSAYEHYRHGKNKETLTDALKAFESTMKVICGERGWTVGGNGTAKDLIQALHENGLIPTFWQGHFSGLRSVLESGVPTARNRISGHGQGTEVTAVPNSLASYVLHMTAATIVFLVKADAELTRE